MTLRDSVKLIVGPDSPDNEAFGKLLEKYRIEAGFSKAEIAHILDFSAEYIRLIERGERVPALGIMSHILKEYGIKSYRRADRDLFIPLNDGTVITVKFTSRILESRKTAPVKRASVNRQKLLGQIVELLPQADNEILTLIQKTLTHNN